MPKVLTTKPVSTVTCGHGPGDVQCLSVAKLQVNGSPVLLETSVDGKPIVNCATVPASDASGPTAIPCTLVATVPPSPPPAITSGRATKLMVNSQPVILDTLAGKTNGMVAKVTPQTLLRGTANHNKLTSV